MECDVLTSIVRCFMSGVRCFIGEGGKTHQGMVIITSCETQQQLVSSVHTNDKQRGFDMSL